MVRLVLSALVFGVVLLSVGGPSDARTGGSPIVYGWGGLDPASSGDIQASKLPSGNRVGQVAVGGLTQGGAFALAPDGRRAYLLDREQTAGGVAEWHLSELEAPLLKVVRRAVVRDAISLLGTARVVAVAADGQQVYGSGSPTARTVSPSTTWRAAPSPAKSDSIHRGAASPTFTRGQTARWRSIAPLRGMCGSSIRRGGPKSRASGYPEWAAS
jgi:hypothetical protein